VSPSSLDPRRIGRGLSLARSLPRRRLDSLVARFRGSRIERRELWLTNTSGYRIFGHMHEPADDEVRPAVVLVPGRDLSGGIFCSRRYLLSADELAMHGIRTIHFDPVGRGRSWGHDDFCGQEGQDSLRTVLDFVHNRRNIDGTCVGLLSFSSGLCLAAPVLAREGRRLGTRFLVDWEGPATRHEILRGGPLPPSARTAMAADPERFWALREPIAWIHELRCHYVRIQARDDHNLGAGGQQSALKLVAEATRGEALSTRLGDNNADTAWRPEQAQTLDWATSDTGGLNACLVRTTLQLTGLVDDKAHSD